MKIKFFTSYYLIFSQGFKISRMIYISASFFFSFISTSIRRFLIQTQHHCSIFNDFVSFFFSSLTFVSVFFYFIRHSTYTKNRQKKFSLIALTYQTHTGHHHITHDKKANRNSFSLCSISFMSFKIIA
jgi:hypothetical protein